MDKDIFIKLLAQREFKAVRSILDVTFFSAGTICH